MKVYVLVHDSIYSSVHCLLRLVERTKYIDANLLTAIVHAVVY